MDKLSTDKSAFNHCWMQKVFDSEKGRTTKLNDIFMPGSHDAGTYNINNDSPIALKEVAEDPGKQSLAEAMSLPLIGDQIKHLFVVPFAKAQHKTIYQQLCDGIRYFDLRPCDFDGSIWISHTLGSVDIDEVIADIKRFTVENPKEIILLDCAWIWGATSDVVKTLYGKITSSLGTVMAKSANFQPTATLNEFWEAKAQVLVFFPAEYDQYSDYIWSHGQFCGIENSDNYDKTYEANIKNINDNIKTLATDKFRRIPCQISPMESLMGTFNQDSTGSTYPYAIKQLLQKVFNQSLETYAESNKQMIPSIRDSWNDRGYIFTFDFYDNCNVVDEIIALNQQ